MKSHRQIIIGIAAIFVFSIFAHPQKFENLALTPPMGWNSWNGFGCQVDEKLIRETADSIVSSGMKDAGYQYLVIDDCWHGVRDAQGFIQPNAQHFPSGMKALGDYIHSKGLKFGIYSDVGAKTCGGHPGSRGHEYQDALTYASWGVDYLKYDWCNSEGINPIGAYTTMRDALYAAGRPIVFSICEWGDNKPWDWAKPIGHLWRTTGDITHCWDCEENHGSWSSWGIMRILDKQKGLRIHAAPGHWNDPDMMEVGNGMTLGEDRAHFSLWQTVRARHIELKRIASGILAPLDDLVPGVAVVLLHDRGDENPLGILVLYLFEFIDPRLEAAIGNKLDILPTINLTRLAAPQPRVPRLHVDHFARIQADSFADHRAPALLERLADNIRVGPRRSGADYEWIGKL